MTRKRMLKVVSRVDVYTAIIATLTLVAVLILWVWVGSVL